MTPRRLHFISDTTGLEFVVFQRAGGLFAPLVDATLWVKGVRAALTLDGWRVGPVMTREEEEIAALAYDLARMVYIVHDAFGLGKLIVCGGANVLDASLPLNDRNERFDALMKESRDFRLLEWLGEPVFQGQANA